jgi:hypothetical protein
VNVVYKVKLVRWVTLELLEKMVLMEEEVILVQEEPQEKQVHKDKMVLLVKQEQEVKMD